MPPPSSMSPPPTQPLKPLFGGMISVELPASMRDESDCYPVPDHQEIFLDEATQQCVIVEIVEHNNPGGGAPEDVCRYYLDDMAQLNEATSTRDFVCECPSEGGSSASELHPLALTPALRDGGVVDGRTSRSLACRCVMEFPKGDGATDTPIRLLIVQLPDVGADVLVSVKGGEADGLDLIWENMCKSFAVRDLGLFG